MKISLVTPSYNQGKFIAEALSSIISQKDNTFDLQLIVQDNCSHDATALALEKYKVFDSVQIVIEKDNGQADALNRGFVHAKGDIYGWLNSDDVLLKGALSAVAKIFQENPHIDVVYGDAYFIDERGVIQHKYPTAEFNPDLLFSTCFLSQPSVFFKRSIFEQVGGLNHNLIYCLDYNLWIKFFLAGAQFFHLKKCISATRIYPGTKTSSGGGQFVREIHQMLANELGKVPASWALYFEYSELNNYRESNSLSKFMLSCIRFFRTNPSAAREMLPWLMHLFKTRGIKQHLVIDSSRNLHFSEL